jgi:hypothetical protein
LVFFTPQSIILLWRVVLAATETRAAAAVLAAC